MYSTLQKTIIDASAFLYDVVVIVLPISTIPSARQRKMQGPSRDRTGCETSRIQRGRAHLRIGQKDGRDCACLFQIFPVPDNGGYRAHRGIEHVAKHQGSKDGSSPMV